MPNVAVMPRPTVLHGYFRSAASWRVRIALGLKGIAVRPVFHHLRRGEQRDPAYLALNPQGLVPALELDDGTVLTQSLAIIEWLDDAYPEPKLLPADPVRRARVRAFALVLAADTHPLQNLGVLARLRGMGRPEAEVQACGPRTPMRLDWPHARRCWRARPVRSASAPHRRSPISAWCRNSATPGASAWT